MIEILFGLTVVIVFFVIIWASSTLKEEYRYKNTLDQDTIEKAKLDKDDKKKHTVGGRP
ncbi:MAG: hypothetical protein HY210_03125 [Candidatus Omnitrophica bacterium]|nr:hypothetical protein [Candidatus Omnitrophota bacterium]MBI5024355.1 hypothetical protein [Candidatus Omnitrophota bacterium]